MSADELIRYISDAGLLVIFAAVVIEALRQPSKTSWLIAAFFGGVALIATASLVTYRMHTTLPLPAVRVEIAVLMVLPWLLLNVAADFGGISRAAMWICTAAMILATASASVVQLGVGARYILAILSYFVIVTVYATWRFVRLARASKGVTRRRMQAVATGSGFLALAIAFAAANNAAPTWGAAWNDLTRLSGLFCVVSYFVGFAPPRTLRRLWQDSALRAFMGATTTVPPTADVVEVLSILNETIASILGAPNTLIALWDEDEQRLIVPGMPPLPTEFRRNSSVAARVFETQRPTFVTDALRTDPDNADVYRRFGAKALMIAPITTGGQRLGIVSAFADHASVFALEDLALLEVLARELAGFLQRREMMEQLTHVRARDEANRLKEEFLAAAAHDLRTPLTVIIGQMQLMERRQRRQPESPVDPRAIDAVLTEAQRMRDLTEDLLSISRSDATGFVGERVTTDLFALALQVTANAEQRTRHHHISVDGEHIDATVDDKRIRQVLTNLVDNAIKFSPTGGSITITISEDDGAAHVTVVDDGIGIPAADLDLIFDRFQRGSSEAAKRLPGTGVGLFICKRIVEEHGGRIWAERVEAGSRFRVTLPLSVTAELVHEPTGVGQPAAS